MRLLCVLIFSVFLIACGESGGAATSSVGESRQIASENKKAEIKKIPVSAQGQTDSGVSVRVKSVDFGEDVTTLDVSMSFSNRMAGDSISMAFGDTFIVDEAGNRLQLQHPEENKNLKIKNNGMLNNKLVFMGGFLQAHARLHWFSMLAWKALGV